MRLGRSVVRGTSCAARVAQPWAIGGVGGLKGLQKVNEWLWNTFYYCGFFSALNLELAVMPLFTTVPLAPVTEVRSLRRRTRS